MNKSTENFLQNLEKGLSIRESISNEVTESRFYFYTKDLKADSTVTSLAKNSEESALAEYILKNQKELGVKVRLSKRGARRLAQQLVLKYRA